MDKLYRCQVFTPVEKVNKLLDSIDYKHDLYGKKILENSCGNGAVLSMVIERYIQDCLKNNFDLETIKDGLEKDIWAFEIDSKKYKECLKNINNIIQKGTKRIALTNAIMYAQVPENTARKMLAYLP